MRRVALVAALAMLAPVATSAQPAPDPKAQGKELFEQGKRYYDVADYPHAIDAWKQAYVVAPTPILLFNIGQAYRLSGDCASAARFYANYEREQPNPPNKDELDQAKALCVAAPAPVALPVKPIEPPPQAPPLTSAQLGSADLDAGSAAKPVPAPVPASPHDVTAGTGLEITGVATGTLGAALVVTGTVFGLLARSDANKISSLQGVFDMPHQQIESSGQTDSTVAVITLGVGAAAVIGGAAMFYLGMRRNHESYVDLAITPQHTELTWTARF